MAVLMEAMRIAKWPLRPSGPIICPKKLLPTGFRVIDTCPGPGYSYFVRGRVDSEPKAGNFMPREKGNSYPSPDANRRAGTPRAIIHRRGWRR
jgi:hypothetical protein